MSNSEAYRKGLTGRAVRNPYPSGSSEWKSWNLGKAGRGRRKLKIKPKGPVLVRQGTTLHGKTYPAPKRKAARWAAAYAALPEGERLAVLAALLERA